MTKKLLAVVLGLSAWIGGTVAATIGNGTAAQASPLFELQKAHADFTPSLDGNTPIFILLMGSDSRPGVTPMDKGRSDSIHILGINPAAHRATVFGIPRDSYVPLSTGGTDKINAAMPIGGPEAEMQTIENVTGIKFDYYVLTGFQQVTQAVNQIGGLEVNVPYSVVGDIQTFPSGLHRMTGQEVLGYSRTRHSLPLGDFDRSLNQGVVLLSALTQFRAEYAKDPTRLYSWLGAGLRTVQTTVPIDELIKLAGLAQSIPASRVTNLVALGTSAMQGTQSIVNLSPENQALWQDMAQDGYILKNAIPKNATPAPLP
jgi:LCP family protein required for cell wall assembly